MALVSPLGSGVAGRQRSRRHDVALVLALRLVGMRRLRIRL